MVAILSMSSSSFSKDCKEVISAMKALGMSGDVSCNTSLVDGGVEQGCRVVLASSNETKDVASLWLRIRQIHNVTCAHAKIEKDAVSGCILDIIRPSLCPGKQQC